MGKKFFNIIGTMTGTSMDGIDISLVSTNGEKLTRGNKNYFYKYKNSTRDFLLNLSKEKPWFIKKNIKEFNEIITDEHYMALQKSSFLNSAEFVGFHGQTIYHNIKNKLSIQLGSPKLLANKINKSVISKFRDKDIRNGGVGAPLAPIYHKFLIEEIQLKQPAAIINIGGISNITYVNKNKLIGFDTGPGNNLMDQFMQLKTNLYYDENGELASKGLISNFFINLFLKNQYLKKDTPKSLDKHDFSVFFNEISNANLSIEDIMATLLECTVLGIKSAINKLPQKPYSIIVVGGGYKNKFLLKRLKNTLKIKLISQDKLDFSFDYVEAELIAFLSARVINNLATTFPDTTGVKKPIVGGKIFYKNPF